MFDKIINDAGEKKTWEFLLLHILQYSHFQYAEFQNEIINSNRFIRFIENDKVTAFFDRLEKSIGTSAVAIKANQKLYRARLIGDSYYKAEFKKICEKIISKKEKKSDFDSFFNNPVLMQSFFRAALPMAMGDDDDMRICIVDYLKKLKSKRFQGYLKNECSAPPAHLAQEGRLNPQNISYLYAAEKPTTAIYEVKPIIGQAVSVATLKINKDLTVLDLSGDFAAEEISLDDNQKVSVTSLIQVVSEQFQIPNYNEPLQYIPTQYIAEYVKNIKKYDGIKFKSSLHKDGVNVVLFNEKNCDVINSKVYCTDNISIEYHTLKDDIDKVIETVERMQPKT